jgi:proteasome accessory factor C
MIGSIRFPTEKPRDFTVPPDYDPEQYRARPPWLIGSVIGTATVSVTEDLAWWVTRLEPHVSRLGETEGLTTFSVPYADEFPLLSWLTGLGTCARLLAPVELRQRAKAAMDAVFRVHERPLRPEASAAEVAPQQGSGRRQNAGATDPIAPEHLARTMSLLAYLLDEDRPQPVTWKALETDLGLTRKDVEEDLDLINLVNFGGGTYALTAEATPEGVEVTREMMADVFSSPARLSPAMAKALLLALDFIGDTLPVEGLESLDPVRQKVSRLIGQDLSAAGVVIDELVKPDPAMVGVLNRAIRDQELVEIDYYTTSRRELSRRLIEPYLLFHSPDGWYVEAFCQKAQAQRTFKLERICAARSTDTPFSPRGGLDLERRRTGDIAPAASEAKWARVVFEPRWATYLQERGTQHVPRADGRLEARVPYLEEAWIVQEVVSFLGEAELESPASARAKISEAARSLPAVYEDPGTPGVSLGGEV